MARPTASGDAPLLAWTLASQSRWSYNAALSLGLSVHTVCSAASILLEVRSGELKMLVGHNYPPVLGKGPLSPPPTMAGVMALNANVLVLNKFYQAIRVINVKRAFSLLCRELAEVIHIETSATGQSRWLNLSFESWRDLSQLKAEFEPDEYDWIHTVRFQIAVPRIIRLLVYEKLPRQEVKFNRRNIYARDSNRCQYCGKKFSTAELSLDHVTPKSQGGRTTWENIVCCCVKCNVKKGGRTPDQARLHLIAKPIKPRRSPVINIRLADERYWSWKQFLDNAYWTVELK